MVTIYQMSKLSTHQVAKKLGIGSATLNRYVLAGKVPAPEETMSGGYRMRLWSESDIERLKEVLPKIANGRKTRWQRMREKQAAQPKAVVLEKAKKKKK